MNFPGRLIAGFMVVILIFIFPLQYIAQTNSENIDWLVNDRTNHLTDTIRDKGFIDRQMYEDYINYLDTTGERYEIELQDIRPVKGEEYSLEDNLGINRYPSFERVSYNEIIPFSTHVHTDDCFEGHIHDDECGGYPIQFDILTSGSYYTDNKSVSIYCGYCKGMLYRISEENQGGSGIIRINSAYGMSQEIRFGIDPGYNNISMQLTTLMNLLDEYRITRKYTSYEGGSFSETINGFIHGEFNHMELPLIGKLESCPLDCSGQPLDIRISGGWNGSTGSPANNYTFECIYCKDTLFKVNEFLWDSSKNVVIYKDNKPDKTYTDASVISALLMLVSTLNRNNLGYVEDMLNAEHSVFNHSYINKAINHGCEYPQPSCSEGYKLHVCNGTDCEYESIVVGIRGYNLYYSKNGITWTNISTGVGGSGFIDITYGNDMFVATDGYSTYISINGIDWTKHTFVINGSTFESERIVKMAFADNGYFYSTVRCTVRTSGRSYTKYYIVKSQDGTNWSLASSEVAVTSESSDVSNIAFARMGNNMRLYVQLSGYHSSVGSVYGYGMYNITSDGGLSSLSHNVSPDRSSLLLVRQIDGYAVINNANASDTNRFYYGVNIGAVSRVNIGNIPSIIQHGNGIFLAIHTGSKSIYTSNVISSFTKVANHNLGIPSSISSNMIYYGDKFLFSGGGRIYMSPDGLSWTSASAPVEFTKFACNADGGSGEIKGGRCIKEGKYYDNKGNEVFPICDQVVTSITATPARQTVDKGKPISLTVRATYLDGHTATITNYTTNYDANKVGNQTVTITYSGLVGNAKTTGTRTCTVSVTVRPDKNLTSITVTPASQTIQKYTSPTFTVRANHSDGTYKILNSSEYSMTGFNPANIDRQKVTISYTENEITKRVTVEVTVTVLQRECPRCNQLYDLNSDDTDPGCPNCKELIIGIKVSSEHIELTRGQGLPITVMAIYIDGSMENISGWTSNYNPQRLGLQVVTIEYKGYAADITVWVNDNHITCPICNTEYPALEDKCPVCAEKVVSISVSPKEITVIQYEPIILSVTALFADGSSREVNGWSIDINSMVVGTFAATVSYKGVSDIITLTVLSINSIECPICGITYDISDNPKGCPICSEELIGIEAYLTSGSNLVQLGTTPGIAIILIFRDEHREFAFDGYSLEDFNPQELGMQTIKVIHQGFSTTVVVEVVNLLDIITCPKGHIYHKNDDGTDPGCPFCHVGEDISKVIYFDITYTSEILDSIYSIGAYHFQKGNYISVKVIKKDKSLLYKLQNTFFSTATLGRKRRYIYGGEVY